MRDPSRDPEFELLLACARLHLEVAQEARIAALLAAGMDWDRLHALADKHGLRPLLFRHLGDGRLGPIPKSLETRLWRHAEQLRRRNQTMETELVELASFLGEHDIVVLAHKGPVVAHRAYGDAFAREYGDLDLLVPKAAVSRAKSLLERKGYVAKFPLAAPAEEAMLASSSQYHFMLAHRDHGMLVELHWRTDCDYAVEGSDSLAWWREAPTLPIQGQPLRCLPADEFLLALCLHGSKHYWGSLHWLVDVAELLRALSVPQWNAMRGRASELRANRRLALGLRLARDSCGIDTPEEVDAWIDQQQGVGAFADAIASEWPSLELSPHSAFERLRRDFALCDAPGQRIRQLWRTIFLPGPREWSRWPLPRPLHFLYVPLRLAGLLGRRGRNVIGRT